MVATAVVVSASQRWSILVVRRSMGVHRSYAAAASSGGRSRRQQQVPTIRTSLPYTERAEPHQPIAPWSVEHLATAWTAPSVVASDHPAVQRVLAKFATTPAEATTDDPQQRDDGSSIPAKVIKAEESDESKGPSTRRRGKRKGNGEKNESKAAKEQTKSQLDAEDHETPAATDFSSTASKAASVPDDATSKTTSNDDDDTTPKSLVDAVGEISGEEGHEPTRANAAPWWSSRQRQKSQSK